LMFKFMYIFKFYGYDIWPRYKDKLQRFVLMLMFVIKVKD